MSYKTEVIKDQPYTIVSTTSMPTPKQSFTFEAGGLRALLEKCDSDEDLVLVCVYENVSWSEDADGNLQSHTTYHSRFEVSKKEQAKGD